MAEAEAKTKMAEIEARSVKANALASLQTRLEARKKSTKSKEIQFIELETAATEIKIMDFIISGEELSFSILSQKLMLAELKQVEQMRILFHFITAQRFDAANCPAKTDAADFEKDSLKWWFFQLRNKNETYAALLSELCKICKIESKENCRPLICLKRGLGLIVTDNHLRLSTVMSKAMDIILLMNLPHYWPKKKYHPAGILSKSKTNGE